MPPAQAQPSVTDCALQWGTFANGPQGTTEMSQPNAATEVAGWKERVRRLLRPNTAVSVIKPSPKARLLATALNQPQTLDETTAGHLQQIRKAMAGVDTPHPNPNFATVADHFQSCSSGDGKLSALQTLIRTQQAASILEIGTAYGISSIAMAGAQETPSITTVELSEVQARLGGDNIRRFFPEGIRCLKGNKNDVVPDLAASGARFDFVFHDGGHDGDAYVRDFETIAPMMMPGGLYLLDDIRWDNNETVRERTVELSRRTCFEGWQALVTRPEVAGAVTMRDLGILLLKD